MKTKCFGQLLGGSNIQKRNKGEVVIAKMTENNQKGEQNPWEILYKEIKEGCVS